VGHIVSRVLLDTHVLLWWFQASRKLSSKALAVFRDPETTVLVSAVCAWEIAIKHKAGRLDARDLVTKFESRLERERFAELPITVTHAIRAGLLKESHKDPFDRMLIAQAQIEGLTVVSRDAALRAYEIPILPA
jgi:PIN domain nuclease of toxin-antitoxin system